MRRVGYLWVVYFAHFKTLNFVKTNQSFLYF